MNRGKISFVVFAEGTWLDFGQIAAQFPFLAKRILAGVGYSAARELYEKHLSGQDLQYRPRSFSSSGAPLSVHGRRMVLYAIDKAGKYVAIRSFPLNLFERGRKLRDGQRGAGKYILRRFGERFPAQLVAQGILQEITSGSDSLFDQAERTIRGSFSEGKSPFGEKENQWRGRWK